MYGFSFNDIRDFQPIIIPKPRLDHMIDLAHDRGIGGDFVWIINGESNTSHLDVQEKIYFPVAGYS